MVLLFLLLLTGATRMHAQWRPPSDSLFIEGTVTAMADSLLPDLVYGIRCGGRDFLVGDSIRIRAMRPVGVQCWARSTRGQVQFESSLPMRVDSLSISVHFDSTGVALVWTGDTLLNRWQPAGTGCFPAASEAMVRNHLAEASEQPFEAMRFTLCGDWLSGQCLTAEQLLRVVAVFDDEERKLRLIQRASCTDPSRMHMLSSVFSSQYFLDAFQAWLSGDD